VNAAVLEAGRLLDLEDVDLDDEDARNNAYVERHHCGVCTVNTVMEVVFPAINDYINFLGSRS
jgi:hypothetical protein